MVVVCRAAATAWRGRSRRRAWRGRRARAASRRAARCPRPTTATGVTQVPHEAPARPHQPIRSRILAAHPESDWLLWMSNYSGTQPRTEHCHRETHVLSLRPLITTLLQLTVLTSSLYSTLSFFFHASSADLVLIPDKCTLSLPSSTPHPRCDSVPVEAAYPLGSLLHLMKFCDCMKFKSNSYKRESLIFQFSYLF